MRSPRWSLILTTFVFSSVADASERGSEQVSRFFGSYSHAIPVVTPAFRGLEPRLSLSYTSQGRNGFAGVGWNLDGFSVIERRIRGTSPVYFLDGQELMECAGITSPGCTAGGTHTGRVETYLKINKVSDQAWIVRGRDGTRTDFSTIITASDGLPLRFGQTSTQDTKGNTVSYAWTCADTDCYPSSATYNGYSIVINKELRPDFIDWGAAGGVRTTKYRLKSVVVQLTSGAKIRAYKPTYVISPVTGRSLLQSLTTYGKDVTVDGSGGITGGTSLPPQTFTYQNDTIGKTFVSQNPPPPTSGQVLENVSWTALVNAAAVAPGNSLRKTTSNNAYDAGAASTRAITAGDGYLEFTADGTGRKVVGLSNGNTGPGMQEIDFGFYFGEVGPTMYVSVEENGTQISGWQFVAGDVMRVEVVNGQVKYKKNGVLLYTSTQTPVYPLLVDTSLYDGLVQVTNVQIYGQLVDVGGLTCPDPGPVVGDFNGDGRSDAVCHGSGGSFNVALANGSNGLQAPTSWLLGSGTGSAWTADDVNGDGKDDIVSIESATGAVSVALSQTTSFNGFSTWGYCPSAAVHNFGTGDFSGDGKADIYCKTPGGGSSGDEVRVGVSTGTSFVVSQWSSSAGCSNADKNGVQDFDGDGRDDLYCVGMVSEYFDIFLSTGSGFLAGPHTLDPTFCADERYVFGDWNGDGRTDVACLDGKVALSRGNLVDIMGSFGSWCGGGMASALDVDGDGAEEIVCNNTGAGATDIQVRKWSGGALQAAETWKASWCNGYHVTADVNGDGKGDLYCNNIQAPVAYAGTVNYVSDLMSVLANGLGGSTQLAWSPSTIFGTLNRSSANYAVNSITALDGRGGSSTTGLTYQGAKTDAVERTFLGFRYARENRPCLPGETLCPFNETWFMQHPAAVGKPETTVRKDGAGNVLDRVTSEYQTNVEGTFPIFARVKDTWTYTYAGTGGECQSWPCPTGKRTRVHDEYDAYGNVTDRQGWGDYDTSGDETRTFWTYVPNLSAYIVDRMARVQTYSGIYADTRLTEVQTYYDNAGTWNLAPTAGYPTTQLAWLNTNDSYVATNIVYDAYGNATSVTDPTSRSVTAEFDSTFHVFPTAVCSAGECSTTTWDGVCGVPTTTKASNQQQTAFLTAYQTDALCRVTRTELPLGGYQIRSFANLGNPNTQYVNVETPPGGGTGDHYVRSYFDGLGRTYKSEARSATDGIDIVTTTAFNVRGGVASTTAPYYSNASGQVTEYFYDAWDRLIKTKLPDLNERQLSYALWSTTSTDENGKASTSRRNLTNPLQTMQERMLGAVPVTTTSTHDLLGRLTAMEDHLGHDWSWTFDSLGRNTQKVDPDAGTWNFVYDTAGRLTSQTDAKNQTTTFAYDSLGRLQTKTNAAGTVTTTYSEPRTGFYNAGLPTTISSPASVLRLDYDVEGKALKQARTLDSVDYILTRIYDSAGFLRGITYPDGDTVGTTGNPLTYDAAGRLYSVPNILTSVSYNAAGQPLVQSNWNNTVTTKTYSATRGFLTDIVTTPGSPLIQNLHYTMDQPGYVGLATQVTSPHPNEGWSYTYDDLFRLTTSTNTSTPAESQTWAYDAINRITNNSRIGNYTYPSVGQARPHAPTQAGSNSYTYDNNGNLTNGAGNAPAWDANNRISSVTAGSTTVNFTYDANGERLKKSTATTPSPLRSTYFVTTPFVIS